MKFHRLGKWGENSISHWNNSDYQAAKDEITKAIESSVPVKDIKTPDEVRQRLKASKAKKRGV